MLCEQTRLAHLYIFFSHIKIKVQVQILFIRRCIIGLNNAMLFSFFSIKSWDFQCKIIGAGKAGILRKIDTGFVIIQNASDCWCQIVYMNHAVFLIVFWKETWPDSSLCNPRVTATAFISINFWKTENRNMKLAAVHIP